MQHIELSAGTTDYIDTGGDGPVVVLLHGLLMDATLWTPVVDDLAADHRCIVPTLPLGAHRHPVHSDAELSLTSVAALVTEFLDALDLDDVTLVGNDTGGALVQIVAGGKAPRLERIALVSCEAFDNLPPGLTGRTLFGIGKLPAGLFGLFMQQLRLKPFRRLPISFGWLTKRGDATVKGWLRPVQSLRPIRRDTVRLLRAAARESSILVDNMDDLISHAPPALIVWAAEDRVMPPEHGRRLAEALPGARIEEVADSYTLIPLDQPAALAQHLRAFSRPRSMAD